MTIEDNAPSRLAIASALTPIVGGLKLEMLEKYSGSQVSIVQGWLNKMEQYFWLIQYPTNIWVDDGIATCITHAAQAWFNKSLQDI